MMKVNFLTLCDFAQDNQGKLSIMGTFNRILANTVPFTYTTPFYIVARVVSKESACGKIKMTCIAPDGGTISQSPEIAFSIQDQNNDGHEKYANFIMGFQNTSFKQFGTYRFRFEILDGEAAETELYLEKVPESN